MRIASGELIGLHHWEGPIVIAFITAIWCKALTALPASAPRGHLLQEASAQISGIKSSNGDELKGSQISVAIGPAVCRIQPSEQNALEHPAADTTDDGIQNSLREAVSETYGDSWTPAHPFSLMCR